jgi:uracil-DNA glycosylase
MSASSPIRKRAKINLIDDQPIYNAHWPPEEVDQSWTIPKIAKDCPPPGWENVFQSKKKNNKGKTRVKARPELKMVQEAIEDIIKERKLKDPEDDGEIYPRQRDIFAAYRIPPTKIKVCILGMDPYQTSSVVDGEIVPKATGLSFSVRKEDKIPKTLNNIYKELQSSIKGFERPDHGNLEEWCHQGVFLLNAALTVNPDKSGSHKNIWAGFIKLTLKHIMKVNPKCIFVLWGRQAQEHKQTLGDKVKIFEAAHPSPLSAMRGFFGCNHFNEINTHLKNIKKEQINWRISTREELEELERKAKLNDEISEENQSNFKISPQFKRTIETKVKKDDSSKADWQDPDKPVFKRR